jgi:hypothetical protein
VCGTHADLWEGYQILFLRCAAHQMKNSAMGEIIRIQFIFLAQRVYPRPLFIFRTLKGNK